MEINPELRKRLVEEIRRLRKFQADIRGIDQRLFTLRHEADALLREERKPGGKVGAITYDQKNSWIMHYGTPEERGQIRNEVQAMEDEVTKTLRIQINGLAEKRSQLSLKHLGVERVDIHGEYDETAEVVDFIVDWIEHFFGITTDVGVSV